MPLIRFYISTHFQSVMTNLMTQQYNRLWGVNDQSHAELDVNKLIVDLNENKLVPAITISNMGYFF